MNRKTALAAFLRTRRARVTPADVGLPPGERRRTPGLRREEVALLAGIGTTWYTWLEQGRDVRMSVDLLERLCQILRLSADERVHLFTLAGHPLPQETPQPEVLIRREVRSLLDALDPCPAYIRNHRWDVLAWNRAELLFTDWEKFAPSERNVMFNHFLNPTKRQILVNWKNGARETVAHFRMDYARNFDDPIFAERVKQLQQRSQEFARWWAHYEVEQDGPSLEEIHHPDLGVLRLDRLTIEVGQDPPLFMRILLPVSGTDGRERLLQGVHTL